MLNTLFPFLDFATFAVVVIVVVEVVVVVIGKSFSFIKSLQLNSSEPSTQSGSPSHLQCLVTQRPSLHLNHSSGLHFVSH